MTTDVVAVCGVVYGAGPFDVLWLQDGNLGL